MQIDDLLNSVKLHWLGHDGCLETPFDSFKLDPTFLLISESMDFFRAFVELYLHCAYSYRFSSCELIEWPRNQYNFYQGFLARSREREQIITASVIWPYLLAVERWRVRSLTVARWTTLSSSCALRLPRSNTSKLNPHPLHQLLRKAQKPPLQRHLISTRSGH